MVVANQTTEEEVGTYTITLEIYDSYGVEGATSVIYLNVIV